MITTRQLSTEIFFHAFVLNAVSDMSLVSIKTKEIGYVCPLYLYDPLFSSGKGERQPNLNKDFFKTLSQIYTKDLSPEKIFYYIYSVLYSNTYRTKYAEFLKIDFPRIPFTSDYDIFSKMGNYGKRLVDLHLLKSEELVSPVAKFQGRGDDKVEEVFQDD